MTDLPRHNAYQAVKAAVPIEEVARRYTELRPAGGRAWLIGRCPLPDHEDKTASFYIYPPRRFHCYGCGAHGDAIDLHFHCGKFGELWEAMVDLSIQYGVKLPERPAVWFARQERQAHIRDGLEEIKFNVLRRRLFRLLEPTIRVIDDEEQRAIEAEYVWREVTPLAVRMIEERRLEMEQRRSP